MNGVPANGMVDAPIAVGEQTWNGICKGRRDTGHLARRLRMSRVIGLLLVVFGVGSLAAGGLTWSVDNQMLQTGPAIAISGGRQITFPPLAGGLSMMLGGLLIVQSRKRSGAF
jgi:hypothetical protein